MQFIRISAETEKYLKSPQFITIAFLYFLTFFGLVFANTKDVSFMGVDEGSITTAINELFIPPYYDMLASYHSKFYGWTQLSINFILLAPIKALTSDPAIVNTSIRFILFITGLLTITALHRVILKLTNNNPVSLAVALYFAFDYTSAHYWYTIHPESTGMLFFLLGIMAFLKYIENKKGEYYFICISFLALSSLSKQPFFIMSLPIVIYMFMHYCDWSYKKSTVFITSKEFAKVFALTLVLAIVIFSVINPYAVVNFNEFLSYQLSLYSGTSEAKPFSDALSAWKNVVLDEPIIIIQFIITTVTLILIVSKKNISLLFSYSVFTSSIIMLIFIFTQRLFITAIYIAPLYPVFFINLAVSINYLIKYQKNDSFRNGAKVISICIICALTTYEYQATLAYSLKTSLLHERTTQHLSWDYISRLPVKSKIVYDPNVGIPPENRAYSCHVWQGCQTKEQLEGYNPDYFILYKDYKYMDKDSIFSYIKANNYCVITTISPTDTKDKIKSSLALPAFLRKYINIFHMWSNGTIIGYPLTVYKRCS